MTALQDAMPLEGYAAHSLVTALRANNRANAATGYRTGRHEKMWRRMSRWLTRRATSVGGPLAKPKRTCRAFGPTSV